MRVSRSTDNQEASQSFPATRALFWVQGSPIDLYSRDKTISNELKIYELKDVSTLDPYKLESELLRKLEEALDKILKREWGLRQLYDPKDMAEKYELDKIVFCDILGLSEKEMEEAREALAEIVKRRVERFQNGKKIRIAGNLLVKVNSSAEPEKLSDGVSTP